MPQALPQGSRPEGVQALLEGRPQTPQAVPGWQALGSRAPSNGRTLAAPALLEGRPELPQALLQGRAVLPHTPLEGRALAVQSVVTVQEGGKPQDYAVGHSEF